MRDKNINRLSGRIYVTLVQVQVRAWVIKKYIVTNVNKNFY